MKPVEIYKDIYQGIGKIIKEKRKKKGWSQKDLAKESKVGRPKISELENGKNDYMVSTLLQVCGALGLLDEMMKHLTTTLSVEKEQSSSKEDK